MHGYKQQYDIDYDETFSPVIKPQTTKTILSLAVSVDCSIWQLYIKNVFSMEVSKNLSTWRATQFPSLRQPWSFCWLNRALCRLKQAPYAWFHRFGRIGTKGTHSYIYILCSSCPLDRGIYSGITCVSQVDAHVAFTSSRMEEEDLGLYN